MFFGDPIVALREMLRVIRDDGYVSFAVWGPEEHNPFFTSINDVVDRFVESPEPGPDAPDVFRFSASGKLRKILENAGAEKVVERKLNFQIQERISPERFWQLRTEMSESLRGKIARLAPDQLPIVRQAAIDAARKYFVNGKMSFPAESLIVTGRKSAKK
jgi:hypothetical protein